MTGSMNAGGGTFMKTRVILGSGDQMPAHRSKTVPAALNRCATEPFRSRPPVMFCPYSPVPACEITDCITGVSCTTNSAL